MGITTKRRALRVVAAVGCAFIIWLFARPPEPTYDNRRLSEWMTALGGSDSDEEAHAFAAIQAMGTNALPGVLRLLAMRDSSLSQRCAQFVQRIPLTLFSMWLGFFAWYRGLVLGGVMRVSQVQLLQPFLALLAAVPLLGEKLEATTVFFALAVVAVVFIGKRMPVRTSLRGEQT